MSETKAILNLCNSLAEIDRLSEFIEEFGAAHGMTHKDIFAFTLSLEELVTNIINYGYKCEGTDKLIRVTMEVHDGTASALLEDQAPEFDPFSRAEVDISLDVDDRPIGGLGIHLCKKMMDYVSYDHTDGYNRVHLHRVLRGSSATIAVPVAAQPGNPPPHL